jgi:hypothetical protein
VNTVWIERNRDSMVQAIGYVKARLEAHAARKPEPEDPLPEALARVAETGAPSALASLMTVFRLSCFERDVLLLCAAFEMDASIGPACAAASDARRPFPTFGLALAAFPGAHWSALTPGAALRYLRLIEVDQNDGLTTGRLRIDERILHHLAGLPWVDPRLQGLIERIEVDSTIRLIDGHREAADRVCSALAGLRSTTIDGWAPLQICGADRGARELVVADACRREGLALFSLRAADVPGSALERDALSRLWLRETGLGGIALLVELGDSEHAETTRAVAAFLERVRGVVVLSSREPLRLQRRTMLSVELSTASTREQEVLWRSYLGPLAEQLDGAVSRIASHFQLGPTAMRAVANDLNQSNADPGSTEELAERTWTACRRQARPRLDDLAQRIDPNAGFEELVLPVPQMRMLRGIVAQVRQRALVYEKWGFGRRGGRGLGITVLFSGASGTGKTLAAEVLASELKLDLYRIDLSQVVSKYIGETEKNLRRVFDAAEEGGAILLFDEADALFGKRSEVKDSHDRYANLEISYLLQRMEAYRGLAILTSNLRSALDPAFTRRLRFIVEFPFPGVEERAAIWSRVFPRDVPVDKLSVERLARLNVTGGVIRNIALGAAFLAADAGQPVRMAHLRQSADLELLKLERPATDAELGGWS